MRHEQHERVAGDREKVEGEKGAPMSPAIDEHAAGIRVDGAEQRAERIEKADDENARAEGLEIFREEPHPKFLTRADDERGNEQDDEVALEREKFRGATPEVHDGFHFISVPMIESKSRSDNSSRYAIKSPFMKVAVIPNRARRRGTSHRVTRALPRSISLLCCGVQ